MGILTFLSVSLFCLVCKYVCPVRETINYQKIDRSGLTRNLKVQFQNLCSLMVFFSKGVSAEQGSPICGNALMRPFGATNEPKLKFDKCMDIQNRMTYRCRL